MDASFAWQQIFENWPKDVPKVGIVTTNFQESIGFTDFLTTDGLLALERDRPDSAGARKVIVAFSAISAVKMTDVGEFTAIAKLGFQ
ncbi:hypothetical protein [Thalassoglobus sp.]|uniref:hypothetical protein n=1 Tax=Thalassoglobus sp. TaxID=2795869 RepID=UPI003AA94EDF